MINSSCKVERHMELTLPQCFIYIALPNSLENGVHQISL